MHFGAVHNDVTALGGRGYQEFCDKSTKVLLLKGVTMGVGVSKIIENCVTSFMDDPFVKNNGYMWLSFRAKSK
jgi:hypothetical protein